MALTVTEIQNRIASILDKSPSAPTEGGTDWNTRLKYMNMAEAEWAELYDWQALYKEYGTQTSTSTGNASITMPTDFRRLATYPVIEGNEYAEIRPQERGSKSVTDKYVYFMGNPLDGYTMVVNPGQLASGASITVPYYAGAGSLASGSSMSMIPDPNYLVQRTIAFHWESSGDERFPQAKAESDKIMQRLLERETVHSEAANDASRVRTTEESRLGFRLGRD